MKRNVMPYILALCLALLSVGHKASLASAWPATAPYAPTLVSPYDWAVVVGEAPKLCAQANGDADGDAIVAYRFKVEGASLWDSGWVKEACATPLGLSYATYRWRAQVKDATGEVSDWSESWHFTLDSPYVTFTDIHFDPPSPSDAKRVRIYACTQGHAGVGVTLQVGVNDAFDGSANGEWHLLYELGVPCFNEVDAPWWQTTDFADGPHLLRIRARIPEDASWEEAATAYRTYMLLPRGVPQPPTLLSPVDNETLISSTIAFRWVEATDAVAYRLLVSEEAYPENNPIVDVTLDAPTTVYTVTLPAKAAVYSWRVVAENDTGRASSPIRQFSVQPIPPSQVLTLILFPRTRMRAQYGADTVTSLANTISLLAADNRVRGVVLDPGDVAEVADAYAAWGAQPTEVRAANHVAETIKEQVILPALAQYPHIESLILVGNDAILPYRRLPDPTRYSERLYGEIAEQTPLGVALAEEYFLSDDYYASLTPRQASSRPLYLPDLVVGRLVESPGDIVALIKSFLANSPGAGGALVTGYDFMTDAGAEEGELLKARGVLSRYLLGENWQTADLRTALRDESWGLVALNQHANHWSFGAPQGDERLSVTDIQGLTTLSDALAIGPGCQAGLSVPDALNAGDHPLDWPQAFSAAGSAFIGNTGFGWGVRGAVGYSERLAAYMVEALLADQQRTIGEALRLAKLRYRAVAGELDALDEKVLQEFTLYGVPQSRPLLANQEMRIQAAWSPSMISVALPQGLTSQTHTFRPELHWASIPDGAGVPQRYAYTRDERDGLWLKAGWPAQPQERLLLTGNYVHGVVFAGGVYSDVVGTRPFVPYAENEVFGADETDRYPLFGWAPSQLGSVVRIDANTQALTVVEGQHRLGVMRVYPELTITAYLSDLDDWSAPWIDGVTSATGNDAVTVTVKAGDEGGLHEIWLTYTEERVGGMGEWHSVLLSPGAGDVWSATVPITMPIRYMVQVVDTAGNVTVTNNDGAYFRAPAPVGSIGRHCGGVGPLDEDFCACVWGVVRVDGEPVSGAEVTLSFGDESVSSKTGWGAVEDAPYYDLSGLDLGLRRGDVFTLTVSYQGEVISRRLHAQPDATGEQQVDLWLGEVRQVWLPVMWR